MILLVLLFIGKAADAQVRIGPVAGINTTRWQYLQPNEYEQYSSNWDYAFQAGLAGNYRITNRYSLHTEWQYLQRVKSVDYTRKQISVTDYSRQNYLSIPALFRVSFHANVKKSHIEAYLNAGPALQFWLGGKGKLTTNELADFLDEEGSLEYKIFFDEPEGDYTWGNKEIVAAPNRWQMLLYAGGGLVFDMGRGKHFWVDLRSTLGAGASSTSDSGAGEFGLQLYKDDLRAIPQSISLSVGYFQDINVRALLKKGRRAKSSH